MSIWYEYHDAGEWNLPIECCLEGGEQHLLSFYSIEPFVDQVVILSEHNNEQQDIITVQSRIDSLGI